MTLVIQFKKQNITNSFATVMTRTSQISCAEENRSIPDTGTKISALYRSPQQLPFNQDDDWICLHTTNFAIGIETINRLKDVGRTHREFICTRSYISSCRQIKDSDEVVPADRHQQCRRTGCESTQRMTSSKQNIIFFCPVSGKV